MARMEKTISLGHRDVRVTELTVGDVRNLMGRDDLTFDAIDCLLGKADFPPDLLAAFTDLTPQAIPALTFSEMKEVIEAVEEVNAAFFFVLRKLGMVTGMAANLVDGKQTGTSIEPSAS